MRAVFRTPYPIPELNAQPDDLIIVEDPTPDNDYLALVVLELGEESRQELVDHLPNLELVSCDGASTPPGWIRRWLSTEGDRRRPSPVSEPIEAPSDEVALFDLITDSGGRMPLAGGGEVSP